MLAGIHPLGERARNNRWGLTATAFTVGAAGSGAVVGAILGFVGSWLPDGTQWRWGVALVAALAAGAADLARIKPPGPRRQVNEDWIGAFRGWVYGGGFGAQLGVGFATYVVTWGVWAAAVTAALVGSVSGGALVGAVFGAGRSLMTLAAGWIDRPSRLISFNARVAALATPVARGVGTALVALGLMAAVGTVV